MFKYFQLALVIITALLLVLSLILCGYTIIHFTPQTFLHNIAHYDLETIFILLLPVVLLVVTLSLGMVYRAGK